MTRVYWVEFEVPEWVVSTASSRPPNFAPFAEPAVDLSLRIRQQDEQDTNELLPQLLRHLEIFR